jgi:hypothetical protein
MGHCRQASAGFAGTTSPAVLFVSILGASILGSPCFAHHGVAPHYDDSTLVEIQGVVARFDFINPHSFVYVSVVDDGGSEQVWACELASRSVLSRNGLTADTFEEGQTIRIEGSAARINPTGCALRTAYFADGSVLRSTELFGPTLASADDVPPDLGSIVGIWTMKRFSVSRYEGVLTPAGERAREAFDPIADDPAIYCDPASPVRFWVNVNEPFEIRRDGDDVIIDHRFMDSRRVVYLSDEGPPPGTPRTAMGYSTGRFEGAALIVSTDHFTAAALEPRYGVMHTQDLRLTERLEVNRATGDLEITWVIDDPAYFKEPLTQKERFVRSPWDPEPYDCEPGYQQ